MTRVPQPPIRRLDSVNTAIHYVLRRDAGGGRALHREPIEITVGHVVDAYGSCGRRRVRVRSFSFEKVPAGGIEKEFWER